MNINSHEEAKDALLKGYKIRNIRYSENEYIFLNADGNIETEEGYNMHSFDDEFWMLQKRLPERWHIVEEKSERQQALEWWNDLFYNQQQEYNYQLNGNYLEWLNEGQIEELWRKGPQHIKAVPEDFTDHIDFRTQESQVDFEMLKNTIYQKNI